MKNNDQESDLCEAHQAFLIRYMEVELRRQAQVSERFLRDKRAAAVE